MAKLKVIRESFGIIPNDVLNNQNLSFKAKGLYGYIQSKPDGWDFSAERIAAQTKDGYDSVCSGLRELESYGLLIRTKTKNEKGMFETEYELRSSIGENPGTENPGTENPGTENPLIKKERDSKKEISNKETEHYVFANVPLDNFPKLKERLSQFTEFRKQIRAPIRPASVPAFLKKLTELSGGNEEEACKVIEQSMANGWRGIFAVSKKREKALHLETF